MVLARRGIIGGGGRGFGRGILSLEVIGEEWRSKFSNIRLAVALSIALEAPCEIGSGDLSSAVSTMNFKGATCSNMPRHRCCFRPP